jgi:hypothetical protein
MGGGVSVTGVGRIGVGDDRGVLVGVTGVFVRIGVSDGTFPPGCEVGEGVTNGFHKKNLVFVEVKDAVGVRVGVLDGKEVGEDLLGVIVAFAWTRCMVDVGVAMVTAEEVGILVEDPPLKSPNRPFAEPGQKINPTNTSTVRIVPILIKYFLLFASPNCLPLIPVGREAASSPL